MLGDWLAEQILSENTIKNVIVIYPGRFQPMGQHHAAVYKKLASKFGKSNTFIATSDKVKLPKSPLNFKEKQMVMAQHGITNVVQVKNPYQSLEITSNYDPETTAGLFDVGKKDMQVVPRFRVGVKKNGEPSYFQYYDKNKNNLQPYTKHGYLYVAPHVSLDVPGYGEMSGTVLRQALANASQDDFRNIMGFFNPKVYNLLRKKFSQIANESIERFLIENSSTLPLGKSMVDDGPRYFYGNQATYRAKNNAMAQRLGYTVLNYIVKDEPLNVHDTEFPKGPPMAVSYFPVGDAGAKDAGTNYSKEMRGSKAYKEWSKYISNVAQQVGYKFLDFLDASDSIDSSKSEPTTVEPLVQEQLLSTEWWASITEQILDEAKANTHLTHLEELILTQGEDGYKQARSFLVELLKNLAGNSNSKVNTSVKWDGAPALFAGINPDNGKFFVGTKSIFNKVPKINYTKEDVDINHGQAPGLADKLKKALDYLPPLGIQNILQGDFMFDDSMVKSKNIDGKPHLTFRPNTITYAVESDSELGREVAAAKFGIVFHTTYQSLTSGAQFGADVSKLRRDPNVWFDDAFFKDTTGVVTLTANEAKQVQSLIKQADTVKINYNELPSAELNIYLNSEIKTGEFVSNPALSFDKFANWMQSRIDKKVEKLKSDAGKARATQSGVEQMQRITDRKNDIVNLFTVSKLLSEAKLIFVKKYNNAVYNTKHFVDDGKGGLRVTAPEGYVAVDRIGNGVKFVDRIEFSRANFTLDKTQKFT